MLTRLVGNIALILGIGLPVIVSYVALSATAATGESSMVTLERRVEMLETRVADLDMRSMPPPSDGYLATATYDRQVIFYCGHNFIQEDIRLLCTWSPATP